eukprot:168268-Amphidinium_carterae.1
MRCVQCWSAVHVSTPPRVSISRDHSYPTHFLSLDSISKWRQLHPQILYLVYCRGWDLALVTVLRSRAVWTSVFRSSDSRRVALSCHKKIYNVYKKCRNCQEVDDDMKSLQDEKHRRREEAEGPEDAHYRLQQQTHTEYMDEMSRALDPNERLERR